MKYLRKFNESIEPYHKLVVKDNLNYILLEVSDITGLSFNISEGPLPDCVITVEIMTDFFINLNNKDFNDCLERAINYMKFEGYNYNCSLICPDDYDDNGFDSCKIIFPFNMEIHEYESISIEFTKK